MQENIIELIKFVKKDDLKCVIENLMIYKYSVDIDSLVIIGIMINSIGIKETEKFIENIRTRNRELWEYHFLVEVSKGEEKSKFIPKIYKFFETKIDNLGEFNLNLCLIKDYLEIDKKLIIKITKTVLEKDDEIINKTLSSLFDTEKNTYEDIFRYYENELELFIDTYIKVVFMNNQTHPDLNIIRALIVEYDSCVINKVIDTWIVNYYELHVIYQLDLSFLWLEDNWYEFVDIVLNKIESYDLKEYDRLRCFAIEFYSIKNLEEFDLEENLKIKLRKNDFIKNKINMYENDHNKTILLLQLISNTADNIKSQLIAEVLKISNLVEIEKIITLDEYDLPIIDIVEYLNKQLQFYKNIRSNLLGINYIEYRMYIDDIIYKLEEMISNEEIKEFKCN